MTASGFTKSKYLSDEQIEGILDELSNGIPKAEAARRHETSWTQFKFRFEREPELEAQVEQAISVGQPAFQEMLRATGYWHVFVDKNYRAWRDWAMVHLPEFESLRTQRFEHSVTGTVQLQEATREAFKDLTSEEIKERIKLLEAAKDEHPVIDLPAKSAA